MTYFKKIIKTFLIEVNPFISYLKQLMKFHKEQVLNPSEIEFKRNLSMLKPSLKGRNGVLLVQMVEDYEFTIKLSAASGVLSKKLGLSVNFYDVYIDAFKYYLPKDYFKIKYFYKKFFKLKLFKIYSVFGSKLLYSNSDLYHNQDFIKKKVIEIEKYILYNGLDSINEIELDEILIGDLIYDTYLRFYHKPTITEIDQQLLQTIESALNIFYIFKDTVDAHNVKALLNTYTTYIHHGIPARICLYKGIEVFVVGYSGYYMKKIDSKYPFHGIDSKQFDPNKQLSVKQFNDAHLVLKSRFSGEIDSATFYMKKTAYHNNILSKEIEQLFQIRRRNIVIYVHDFYDSPHINRKLQFRDLFQFLFQTLEAVSRLNDTSVFIKTHPNGVDGSKELTIKTVNDFKVEHFYILDESISNLNIIELKPDLVCTARGTIGLEMAYFQIPTVALFDNPYINFNFVHTCYSLDEYFKIIRGEEKVEVQYDIEKIVSFYFQAFIEKDETKDELLYTILKESQEDQFSLKYLEYINLKSEHIFTQKTIYSYQKAFESINL